jgi:hemimethylated DNA binding protein
MSLVPTLYRAIARGALGVRAIKEAKTRLVPSGIVPVEAGVVENSLVLQKEMAWGEMLEQVESNAEVFRKLKHYFKANPGETEEETSDRIDEAFETMRIMTDYANMVRSMVDQGEYEPNLRPNNLKYRVGDVIVHKYFGKGVVSGWDETCKADEEWCVNNQIDKLLKNGRDQPFYNLLLHDQTCRYCSEENVSMDEEPDHCEIDHPGIPYVFTGGLVAQKRYDATREKGKETYWVYVYEPSPELDARFPEDSVHEIPPDAEGEPPAASE